MRLLKYIQRLAGGRPVSRRRSRDLGPGCECRTHVLTDPLPKRSRRLRAWPFLPRAPRRYGMPALFPAHRPPAPQRHFLARGPLFRPPWRWMETHLRAAAAAAKCRPSIRWSALNLSSPRARLALVPSVHAHLNRPGGSTALTNHRAPVPLDRYPAFLPTSSRPPSSSPRPLYAAVPRRRRASNFRSENAAARRDATPPIVFLPPFSILAGPARRRELHYAGFLRR